MTPPAPSAPPASLDDHAALLHDGTCSRLEALTRIVQTMQARFLRRVGTWRRNARARELET